MSFHRKHNTNVLFPASISFFGPCLAFQCQICISACRNSNSKLSCRRGFPLTCWGKFGVTAQHLSYSHAVLDFNVYMCVSASVLTFELFRIQIVAFKCIILQEKEPQFAAGVKRYVDLMYCRVCALIQHTAAAMQHIARVQGHDTCSIPVSCGVNVAAIVVGATRV